MQKKNIRIKFDKDELKSKFEIAEKKISGVKTDKNEMRKEMNLIKAVVYKIQLKKFLKGL